MRLIWALALFVLCVAGIAFESAAQETQKGGESADSGDEKAAAAEQAARRRRAVMGNVAKLEVDGDTVAVSYGDTPTDGTDYPLLESIAAGDVVPLTQSIVTKLKTDVDLKFGDTVIEEGNVAKDYPGVYGLWLKRTADGWHLVFNEYADVWGTQYFPEADVAEIPLTYAKADENTEAYTVTIPEADGGGAIEIAWGEHRWSASFTIVK